MKTKNYEKHIISALFMGLTVLSNAQIISTIAGNGIRGYSGDGGQATSASFASTSGLGLDYYLNVYIVDQSNFRVREVTKTTGTVNTIAGDGNFGGSGNGGPATSAELNQPFGVAISKSGNIYIADQNNNEVRVVISGTINVLSGNGTAGFSGDGGSASLAELNTPNSVAVDDSGNIYISDPYNERIRKVTYSTGIINTIAGNGTAGFSGDGGTATSAEIDHPIGVAVDKSGNIFIADGFNNRIRIVTKSTGKISTLAGNGTGGYFGDGGAATSAEINYPNGIAVDNLGNIYIADDYNNRIRKVTSGIITTIAGNGTMGYTGDGGNATSAELNTPTGVAVDSLGNIYIADQQNNVIREVTSVCTLNTTASAITNVSCNGGSNGIVLATPSGGTSPFTYSWSGGGANSAKTGLAAGTYTLTVTDNNGCTATASATVTQPSLLSVSASAITNVSCNGGSNGIVLATPSGGTSPFTYSWSGGGANSAKTGLAFGTYTVTVSDNNGCTATASATVNQPTLLSVSANSIINVSCNGGSNGIVLATPSGGTSPYTYSWSGGGANSTKTGLTAGTYTITVTDNNGCNETASATITQPSPLGITIASHTDIYCVCSMGSATANTASGGIPPYTYNWLPGGGNNLTANNLSAGTYTIIATDNNGCTASASVIIIPAYMNINVTSANATSGCNGIAAIAVSGGIAPYTYLWATGGQTTDTIGNQCAGTYCCTITDNNGCTSNICVTLTVKPITTSIEKITSNNSLTIEVYPDPNNGSFTISGVSKGQLIELYDYEGQNISSIIADDITMHFDLSTKANGVYLIRILNKDGSIAAENKIVKMQ